MGEQPFVIKPRKLNPTGLRDGLNSVSGSAGVGRHVGRHEHTGMSNQEAATMKSRTMNPNYTGDSFIERHLLVFEEREGERAKHPDPAEMVRHLRREKREKVQLADSLFKIGFSLEDKFYYIDAGAITSPRWGDDLRSYLLKAKELPQVYFAIHNLSTEVWHLYELTKIDFEIWSGNKWAESDRIGTGLYGATQKRVLAYISRQPDYARFMIELSELKNLYAKLKGLLSAVYQQHYAVTATLSSSRRTNDMIANNLTNTQYAGSMADTDVGGPSPAARSLLGTITRMDISGDAAGNDDLLEIMRGVSVVDDEDEETKPQRPAAKGKKQ